MLRLVSRHTIEFCFLLLLFEIYFQGFKKKIPQRVNNFLNAKTIRRFLIYNRFGGSFTKITPCVLCLFFFKTIPSENTIYFYYTSF